MGQLENLDLKVLKDLAELVMFLVLKDRMDQAGQVDQKDQVELVMFLVLKDLVDHKVILAQVGQVVPIVQLEVLAEYEDRVDQEETKARKED